MLNHHQQYGGGGYPVRVDSRTGETLPPMAGKQIPVFSRIATVVDVYDAATSQRVYQAAKLPVHALFEMRTACRGFFDPQIEQAFYQIIPPFPIGQVVTLSNGVEAVVVDFNPKHPERPKVQGLRDPSGERVSPIRRWKKSTWRCIAIWKSPGSTASTSARFRFRGSRPKASRRLATV